jgi:hypothetical protein
MQTSTGMTAVRPGLYRASSNSKSLNIVGLILFVFGWIVMLGDAIAGPCTAVSTCNSSGFATDIALAVLGFILVVIGAVLMWVARRSAMRAATAGAPSVPASLFGGGPGPVGPYSSPQMPPPSSSYSAYPPGPQAYPAPAPQSSPPYPPSVSAPPALGTPAYLGSQPNVPQTAPLPPPSPPGTAGPSCASCGRGTTFIAPYGRYYCYSCQRYV